MIKPALAATALLSLCLTAACGSSSGASGAGNATKSDYQALFVGPLSGPLAGIGAAQLAGLKAGAARVNAAGGVGGRKVVLKTADDEGDSTKAVSALQAALTSGSRPDFVFSGVTSPEGLAMLPILTREKILSYAALTSAAIDRPSTYPYAFSIGQNQQAAYNKLAAYAAGKGARTLAYLRPKSPAGDTDVAQMQKAAAASGVKVDDVVYDGTAVDLTASMQSAVSSRPDLLVLDAYGPSAGYLLQARSKLDVKIPTVGALIFCIANPGAYASADQLTGVTLLCNKVLQSSPQQPAALTQAIKDISSQGAIKQTISLYTGPYDVLSVVAAGAKQAGSTTAPAISKALESLKQPDPSPFVTYSTISYSSTEHEVTPKPTDYTFLSAAPVTDGQYPAS